MVLLLCLNGIECSGKPAHSSHVKFYGNIVFFFFQLDREKQLKALMRLYEEHETEMCNALAQDLRKSKQESIINEVELLRNDLRNLLMNLNDFAKPEKVRFLSFDPLSFHVRDFCVCFLLSNCSPRRHL